MKAVASISQHPVTALAVGEVAGAILEGLQGSPVDLLFVFIDSSHTGAVEDISSACVQLLSPGVMVGATAAGVIGQVNEVEDAPAISAWAATGVDATPLRISPGESAPEGGWPAKPGATDAHVLLLADPFSTALDNAFANAASSSPGLRLHGGLASGARGPGGNRLLLDGAIYSDGAVGVDLGSTPVRSVVSQGCRPVGMAHTVTGAQGNVITELASQRPLDVLEAIARNASPEDQQLLAGGFQIGVAFNEAQVEEYDQGDFLIRGILGADPKSGAIAIATDIEVGTTVQFQVRDATSASDELARLLTGTEGGAAKAALTFTCTGRGLRFFGRSGHDAELVHDLTGSMATAGMFCTAEFGPVGTVNHVHGFTASTVLFE